MSTETCYSIIKSPVDDLLLVADASAVIGVYFAGGNYRPDDRWILDAQHPILKQTEKELREYFAGKRRSFSMPLRPMGTDFQQRIWQGIAGIPYGKTISYSELAKGAGAPEAVRAAGTATGRNPISIIVPCHRVMGKNGDMCGFGGGLERKRYLLDLENSNTGEQEAFTPHQPNTRRQRQNGVSRQQLSLI